MMGTVWFEILDLEHTPVQIWDLLNKILADGGALAPWKTGPGMKNDRICAVCCGIFDGMAAKKGSHYLCPHCQHINHTVAHESYTRPHLVCLADKRPLTVSYSANTLEEEKGLNLAAYQLIAKGVPVLAVSLPNGHHSSFPDQSGWLRTIEGRTWLNTHDGIRYYENLPVHA